MIAEDVSPASKEQVTDMEAQSVAAERFRDWQNAETAWQAELEKVYKSGACEARYDARGYGTERLKALKEGFHTARIAFENAGGFNALFNR